VGKTVDKIRNMVQSKSSRKIPELNIYNNYEKKYIKLNKEIAIKINIMTRHKGYLFTK